MTKAFLLTLMWCMYAYPHVTNGQEQLEHHIYFVCRASVQKSSLIASAFNLQDTLISHVGIGIMEEDGLNIFHVEDRKENALVVESLEQFIRPGIFHFCVYAKPVSAGELLLLKFMLRNHQPVQFDLQLQLNNDAFYCSEFCFKILSTVNPEKFAFQPITRKISHPFIRSFLGRDSITYIPVDFFLTYSEIKKVREGSPSHR